MTDRERYKRIALMCREILDGDEPFYWNYDLTDSDKDYTIDFLLRAVLGFAEKETEENFTSPLPYIEEKFFSAYYKIR
ncbi:hypothetical protein [Halobacillus litoralis]|uniref:hypothetical protein n=1 Tax=Halobacillus litoralis TaxID=45668 RepID=UPI001CD7611E|nr:hypothetical protein [Halobacillus litoralis]MCA1021773.1 hypothetical protein [Halobacillus litoralis]